LFLIHSAIGFHTKITLFIAENVWRVMVWAIEAVGKCRLYFYGTKDAPDGESVLVIANHISLLDWAYVLAVAGRRARLGAMKFFAKVRNAVEVVLEFAAANRTCFRGK
jgi:1-acyl-sn-glycerol-3-phosphate acyltransferase